MHGLVNRSIQSFLTDTHGEGFWSAVAARIGLPDSGFEPMLAYDDRLTAAMLDDACRRLALPREALLEDLGTYLVSHPRMERLRRLLRFGGANFLEFLQSLDDMPDRGRLAVPDLDLPVLEVRDQGAGRFLLQVRGGPPGSADILTGVLRAMADDYGALAVIAPPGSMPEGSYAATAQVGIPMGHRVMPETARQVPDPGHGPVGSMPQDGPPLSGDIRPKPFGTARPPEEQSSGSPTSGPGLDAWTQAQHDVAHPVGPQKAGCTPQAAKSPGGAVPVPARTGTDAGRAAISEPVIYEPTMSEPAADAPAGPTTGDCGRAGHLAAAAGDSLVPHDSLSPPDSLAPPDVLYPRDSLAPPDGLAMPGAPAEAGALAPGTEPSVSWLRIILHDPAFATGRRFELALARGG